MGSAYRPHRRKPDALRYLLHNREHNQPERLFLPKRAVCPGQEDGWAPDEVCHDGLPDIDDHDLLRGLLPENK